MTIINLLEQIITTLQLILFLLIGLVVQTTVMLKRMKKQLHAPMTGIPVAQLADGQPMVRS